MDIDKEYWEERYINLETGWDVGGPSEPLVEYFSQLRDKKLKLLIPGSGNGYEAEYLYENKFTNTFVLDYSDTALNNFKKRVPRFPVNQILKMDFFDLFGKFDLIIEQTFFCALDLSKRKAYINKMASLLNRGGKLVGLFFDDKFSNNQPPFGCSRNQYLKLLNYSFNILTFDECYNSIESRRSMEFFCIAEKR